jgi:hypothetical protein
MPQEDAPGSPEKLDGADGRGQPLAACDQLIPRARPAYEERLQDAVCGDRVRQRRRGGRRRVAAVDEARDDQADDRSERRAIELLHVVGIGTHPVVAGETLALRAFADDGG